MKQSFQQPSDHGSISRLVNYGLVAVLFSVDSFTTSWARSTRRPTKRDPKAKTNRDAQQHPSPKTGLCFFVCFMALWHIAAPRAPPLFAYVFVLNSSLFGHSFATHGLDTPLVLDRRIKLARFSPCATHNAPSHHPPTPPNRRRSCGPSLSRRV